MFSGPVGPVEAFIFPGPKPFWGIITGLQSEVHCEHRALSYLSHVFGEFCMRGQANLAIGMGK